MIALAVILLIVGLLALLCSLMVPLLIIGFWVFLLLFCVWSFIFWIWMLIDCIKNESIIGNEKVAWVLAIALTHWVGALVYFFAGRRRSVRLCSV